MKCQKGEEKECTHECKMINDCYEGDIINLCHNCRKPIIIEEGTYFCDEKCFGVYDEYQRDMDREEAERQ